MAVSEKILITGASGLLGKELVRVFSNEGFSVLGHYYSQKPQTRGKCKWLRGDFSSISSIQLFIDENLNELRSCHFLINNFGPITFKNFSQLEPQDFLSDFHKNILPAFMLSRCLLEKNHVKSIGFIAFKGAGEIKGYKDILPYAMAKTSLIMLKESFALAYPGVIYRVYFTPGLTGAKIKDPRSERNSPQKMAQTIVSDFMESR